MSGYERIYGDKYYLPDEIACPRCREEEKNEKNPFNLCDSCAEDFDREYQQDVEREAEEWIRRNK